MASSDDLLVNINLSNSGGSGGSAPGPLADPYAASPSATHSAKSYAQNQRNTPPPPPPGSIPGTAPAPGSFLSNLFSTLANPATATSFIGSAVTHATGSPTLGGVAGAMAGTLPFSVLGPAAIVAAAVMATSEINTRISEMMMKTATTVGGIPGSIGRPADQAVFGGLATASGYLDPTQKLTGLNLSLVDDALGAFATGLQVASDGLVKLAVASERFSPTLAMAMAQEDVLNLLAEMRRSRRIGPQLTDFIHARGEASRALDDIKLQLAEKIIPPLTKILEVISHVLQWVDAHPGVVDTGITAGLSGLGALASLIPGGTVLVSILQILGTIAANTTPETRPEDAIMLDQFFKFTSPDALKAFGGKSVPIPKGP